MNNQERSRVLDKIKKCLALGKSPNEHEAAAALRQAQKLMTMHSISDDDVEGIDYVTADVLTDYEFGKKKPIIVIAVAQVIQHSMGVDVVMGGARKGKGFVHRVTYVGPRSRIHAAVYAHAVVYRAVGSAWKKFSAENPYMKARQGSRAGFYAGWCSAVVRKVETLVVSDVEKAGIQRAIARNFPTTSNVELGTKSIDTAAAAAGAELAEDFNISKPLGQDRMRIGRDS